jgi:two-component system, NarL family, nitrate/nitrite response regulator NarL
MIDTQSGPIRLLLVDDHGLFRESLGRLLGAEPGFELVAQCASPEEARSNIKNGQVDVVLLDFDFGGQNCIALVRWAVAEGFKGRILVVTAGLNDNQAAELVHLGVSGIFLKHGLPEMLAQAIRDIVGGKVYLAEETLRGAMAVSAKPGVPPTDRERQVLALILEGLSNKVIGERLGVSESSVKASIQQLFSKTGVRTRSQLVRIALEQYKDLL